MILGYWWNIGGTGWGIGETGGIFVELGGILVELGGILVELGGILVIFGKILVELWVYGGACWCIDIIGWSIYWWIYSRLSCVLLQNTFVYWVEVIKINFDNQIMIELYCK